MNTQPQKFATITANAVAMPHASIEAAIEAAKASIAKRNPGTYNMTPEKFSAPVYVLGIVAIVSPPPPPPTPPLLVTRFDLPRSE